MSNTIIDMSRCYKYRSVQPLADLKSKFNNDFGPAENAYVLSANPSHSLAKEQLITLELDPTLDIDSDQEDPDLTPTAANPQVSWAQESGISLVADQRSEILQRRSFDDPWEIFDAILTIKALCVYFHPYKEAGYLGNDDIYYAIYLRERTTQNLVGQVCRKLAIDATRVKEIVYLSSDKVLGAMNDQVVRGLSNEQSFDVESVAASRDAQGDLDTIESLQMRIHLWRHEPNVKAKW